MFDSNKERGSEIYFGAGVDDDELNWHPGSYVKPRERQPNRSVVCRHEGCQLYLSDGGDVLVVVAMAMM